MPLNLVKSASLYVVVKFVAQGLTFLATLLLARFLKIDDFAIIGIHFLVIAFLLPLTNFSLHNSLERYFFLYDEVKRPAKIFTLVVTSFGLNLATLFIAYFILQKTLNFEIYSQEFLVITLLTSFLQSSQYVPLTIMRCEERINEFAKFQLLIVLLTQSIIVFGVFYSSSVEAFFIGSLLGGVFSFVVWNIWVIRKVSMKFISIKNELRYCLPILPVAVLESLQQVADRFFLQQMVSSTEFAHYSLAQRFSGPVNTVASGAKAAILPILYSLKNEGDVKDFLSSYTNLLVALFGVVVNLLVVFMALVFEFFLSDEYSLIFPLFITVLIGFFFRAQEILLGVGADIKMQLMKKTKLLAPIILFQIIIAGLMTYFYGLWGGALAFVFNCTFRLLALSLFGQKMLQRDINLKLYIITTIFLLLPLIIYINLSFQYDLIFSYDKFLLLITFIPIIIIVKKHIRL